MLGLSRSECSARSAPGRRQDFPAGPGGAGWLGGARGGGAPRRSAGASAAARSASRRSSSFSQISLRVGKAGTACHSNSTGVLLTMAIVAACSQSATSVPVNVAPTITPRCSSTTIRAVPGVPIP